jgi:3' terminal RNA ribose 2'-O-methyltransferase Hen1
VVDLGAGSGALLPALLADGRFTEIVAVDVSARALANAARRLHLDRMPERQRARITLLQSALTYTDARLHGYDAAVLMEVVEHVDPDRLPALEHAVFGAAAPATVIVTTPNAEHNVRYHLTGFRHRDHRFEWTRAEFAAWTRAVASRYGYTVAHHPVGDDDPEVGPPTQLAVFSRRADEGVSIAGPPSGRAPGGRPRSGATDEAST